MIFLEIERRFNRAVEYSFSKKKFLLTFPFLVLCFIMILFSRSVLPSEPWMRMNLVFLAIFLSSAILLSLGVFLIRIYYHEVKNLKLNIGKILSSSIELMVGSAYLSFPFIIIFFVLWILLSIFYFLSKVPKLGSVLESTLVFAPFIFIFCLVFLCFLNICILFFLSPTIGLKNQEKFKLLKLIVKNIRKNFFINFLVFMLGIMPIGIISLLLYITLILTNAYSLYTSQQIDFVRWFFLSLPIGIILAPFIVFFFNFAAEMHQLFFKK